MLRFLENNWISNSKYLFALTLFNSALIINFSDLFHAQPYLGLIGFLLTGLTFLNYKLWWAVFINIAINFYYYAPKFPRLSNHGNLEIFISIGLLIIICCKIFNKKVNFSAEFLSFLFRFSVVTVYFYTGFHKLNTDFFNPCTSCSDAILKGTIDNFTNSKMEFNAAFSHFLHFSTLFLESIVPFGLLFSGTRKWAATIILSFHLFLSLSFYADFSALGMFLIVCCCIDFNQLEIFKSHIIGLKIYTLFSMVSFAVMILMQRLFLEKQFVYFVSGCLFSIGFLTFVMVYFWNYKPIKTNFKLKYISGIIPVLLVINFWTLRTYIGLGNTANFTMFSNLMTEKSRSNHLIIDTKKTKIFNFEEDNVLILALHDSLKAKKLIGYKLPITEFKYAAKEWVKSKKNIKLTATLIYKKDTIFITDLKNSEFSKHKWWYKFLFFRKIQPQGANECYW